MTQFLVSLLPFAGLALLWVVFISHQQRRQANQSPAGQREPQVEGLEPRDDWSGGAIHTYRDPQALERKAPLSHIALGSLLLGLFLVVPGVAIVGFAKGFSLGERLEGAVGLGLFLAIAYFGDRRHCNRVCGEIRLADDGTCELESKRRVIRLHVNQIESVERPNDPDSRAAYYISYQGGSIAVGQGMTDFTDFVSRLKNLNPAVHLTSFPAKSWPDLHAPATDGRRADVTRLIRSGVFPLIVIALLVYLASQTFLGR